jgi:hypothetical protein
MKIYRYDFIPYPYYGHVQFAIGGDIEHNESRMSISRPQSSDAGEWYAAYPGYMNMTAPNGRSRVVTIMTKNDADRVVVTNYIKASTNITEAAKQQMIASIKTLQLSQIEAMVVRLARAYSPDRGNLIVESALEPQFDYPINGTDSTEDGSESETEGVVPFPTDTSVYRQCLNISYTPDQLSRMLTKLRDRDIIRSGTRAAPCLVPKGEHGWSN